MRTVAASALLCACASSAAAQPAADQAPAYVVEYSTVPMVRNAALAELGTRVGERGTDWLLDAVAGDVLARRSTGGVFARIGQYMVDAVIVGTAVTAAHEYGHATRVSELGASATVTIRPFGFRF